MTRLKLNEPIEKFQEFYGRNIEQMPQVLEEGGIPLGVAGLMRKRLEVLTASEDVKDAWWDHYFDTGDTVIYHPDGRFKVVLNAEPVWKELSPESKLKNGSLILPEGTYGKLDGESFTRAEIRRYGIAEKLFTMEEAKKNPIWKALAGGDQALLDAYIDSVFQKNKEEYDYDKNMKIGLLQPPDVTLGRLWCIGSLRSYSDAGSYDLSYSVGRLVRVSLELP